MIEDSELRDLFQIESEEHLQIIEKGLLELEKNPNDLETLHLIFREAHSMKGASRMLGLSDIESISHLFEDMLGKASRGEFMITSDLIDTFYYALDATRKMVGESVSGELSGVDVVDVLDRLLAVKPPEGKSSSVRAEEKSERTETAEPKQEKITFPAEPVKVQVKETSAAEKMIPEKISQEMPAEIKPAVNESVSAEENARKTEKTEIDRIIESKKSSIVGLPQKSEENREEKKKTDTMRVDPAKLDSLMIQASELVVTKNRITNRIREINEVSYYLEELQRFLSESQKLFSALGKGGQNESQKTFILSQLSELNGRQCEKVGSLVSSVNILRKNMGIDISRLGFSTMKTERSIYNIRMLPLSTVFSLFHRTVRDMNRETGKNVNLIIEGGETTVDKQILEELKDPLMHLVRNAIDHGIEKPEDRISAGKPESAELKITGKGFSDTVIIEIKDDGKGIDLESVKRKAEEKGLFTHDELNAMDRKKLFSIIFMHGFSTRNTVTDLSGRGVGMDVVKSFVEKFKGDIETESEIGKGCRFRIRLPIKFSTTNILITSLGGQKFGFPTDFVVLTRTVQPKNIFQLEGKSAVLIENEPVYLANLSDYLERPEFHSKQIVSSFPCVVLNVDGTKAAVIVDSVIEKNEVILKPFDGILKRVRNVTGAAILDSGEVCIVVNPRDIIDSIFRNSFTVQPTAEKKVPKIKKVLVADDSLTTRVQLKRILENEGIEVSLAVDGLDAWNLISNEDFNCVLSDMEMPNMDGLDLVRKVRDSKYRSLPVIILTSIGSDEKIKETLDAGADAYLVKSKFDRKDLLGVIEKYFNE
ncbi:MAG TPA: hybrid sensor histidine kinase/response regulator [Leptospiraceae bacterium]|nr:hybrid sensor histidine kinase/response regulator [Leptospiraceae bacterium]HNI97098.1 hybrid sensor histidine kinase/response regulator [Leptospiraceae bacterium]HNN03909.1 hybrid sensor histidine kinase/response regulator [Leptospiraceae bacterium]